MDEPAAAHLVVYPVGLAILIGSIIRAMHLPARLIMCADHAQDGGVECSYGDVAGRRIATIGVGLAVATLICGLTFVMRRESKHQERRRGSPA
jgi:hypothetical protein